MNDVATVEVTTWYLEQTAPEDLVRPAGPGLEIGGGLRIGRAGHPSPEFSRFLYTAVGGDWAWTDRLAWDFETWARWLGRDAVETWVAYVDGTPAGYVELEPQTNATVEISYFGLLPAFIGKGLGGHLLSEGVARAWDLADRWPARAPTQRVWLHTCSLDAAAALPNYRKRGFRIFDTRTGMRPAQTASGPWPGAR